MTSIREQLESITEGSGTINGVSVTRVDDYTFEIDDNDYQLEDAEKFLQKSNRKKTKGIDYSRTVLLIVPRYSKRVLSHHRVKNRKGHQEVLAKAFKKHCYVYLSDVKKDSEGNHQSSYPWAIDWESVDALYDENGKPRVQFKDAPPLPKREIPRQNPEEVLCCPYCTHPINSTPGRTLHVKSKHPEKYEEYKVWLASLGKN